ncbi:MAG: rhomboid family intramembrane serine protease [Phycisphaerales bacterium]|nr:rhomboid family intramembrane serine protease [Phycisphaerales bacterium]
MAFLQNSSPDAAERVLDWGHVSRHGFTVHGLITSAFFHAGFMHIFGNMIFLIVFGPSVEDRFGPWWYLLFYLGGAAASGLAHIAVDPHPAIGASGAVAAVSGAYLMLFPRTRIKCFVIFFIIGIFMIPSWWLIGLYIVLDLIEHVFTPENGIANMAHLGGYAYGFVIALALLVTGILSPEPYDLFSTFKQRQRRKAFVSAHKMHEQHLNKVMRDEAPRDPRSEHLASARAEIGSLLSEGQTDRAADAYLRMVEEFGHDENAPLTLHRDAQYQIANELYKRGDQVQAADAFSRLLGSYPGDPERHVITVLVARIRGEQQGDVPGAIVMLEELLDQGLDHETKALVESELERIRANPAQHSSEDET